MAGKVSYDKSRMSVLRWLAWIVLIIWGVYWIWFSVTSGFAEVAELGPLAQIGNIVIPIQIIVIALIIMFSEGLGGILLIAEAIFAFFFFKLDLANPSMLLITLFLPAAVIGLLFTLCWMGSRTHRKEEASA